MNSAVTLKFSQTRTRHGRESLKKIEFYYTPKHGSWLNAAEIEIRILEQRRLNKRFPNGKILKQEADAWDTDRKASKRVDCV
ncbi:MAG TPA: hypothetical protein C5S37_13155 [Methanophagales archaeon]|nr:hypothetical protein [Methanophagales archaeon]